nr:ABC transporter permease [Nocardia bovistercoris]
MLPAVNSEVRKATSLRSNSRLVVALAAVSLIATSVTALISGPVDPKADPATGAASVGLYLAIAVTVVAAAVFGAIAVGSEFRYESIPLTALFTADRDRLVAAKYLVTGVLAVAGGVVVELVGLVCLLVFGRGKVDIGLRLFAVLGGGLLAVLCWSLIGAGLALLVRQSSGTVTMLIGWLVVVEPLIWVVTDAIGIGGIAALLPESATVATVAVDSFPDSGILAPTPAAIVVLLLWTAGIGAAGWFTFRTREL